MTDSRDPIGVVLAGGAGRRMGGGKATVALHGTPLLLYPVRALQRVLAEVVVVAKLDTVLPPLPAVPVWTEPPEPRHPLAGLVHALERAAPPQGAPGAPRSVLACAGDLPFVDPSLVERLAHADAEGAPAVVPRAGGRLQPLLARYDPAARAPLAAALARRPTPPLTAAVEALRPLVLDLPGDEPSFFNVNAPEDLLVAAALLDRPSA
jgi:molybdopterin-guanine dinucleotide biosynthesis protein A